ncbi:hypothetical protein A2Z00_03945, partial [Candidatus Gottesmanbacteria bacterium RBG_13_45_10]
MKRIIVSEAGGALTRNFVMSLRTAPEKYHIIGISSNVYDLPLSNADENYLVPKASDPLFIPIIKKLIVQTKADFLHSQHDTVIQVLASHVSELPVRMFLPSTDTVNACVDKYQSYLRFRAAHVPVADTMELASHKDLLRAWKTFGTGMWIRLKKGGGGAGALPVRNIDFAKYWISYYNGWGKFIASERLGEDSVTWTSIWKDGELIVAQGRKRHYWLFANRTLSGVTGVTGAGETVSDGVVDACAQRAISAIDPKPNGIFSVDMTYDSTKKPRVTEINIGRFFTTIHFFTQAGCNMPYIYLKLGLGETIQTIQKKMNPLKSGLLWIRGMDA